MRESIYYCRRRLCATSYFFSNLLLLFASHIVTITITYLFLCFISCLVLFCWIAYSSINLYLIFKHFLLLAYTYISRLAHLRYCVCLLFTYNKILLFYVIYIIKFIAFARLRYCVCLRLRYCICLLFIQRDFSTLELFTQQYFYNF